MTIVTKIIVQNANLVINIYKTEFAILVHKIVYFVTQQARVHSAKQAMN